MGFINRSSGGLISLAFMPLGCIACVSGASPPRDDPPPTMAAPAKAPSPADLVAEQEIDGKVMKLSKDALVHFSKRIAKELDGKGGLTPVPPSNVGAGISPAPGRAPSFPQQRALVRAIGWMPVSEDTPEIGCTVFRVAREIAITAGHCFGAPPASAELRCEGTIHWGRQTDDRGDETEAGRSTCRRVRAYRNDRSQQVDYAVLEIEVGDAPADILDLETKTPPVDTPLQVLGYAKGRPVQYSLGGCKARAGNLVPWPAVAAPAIVRYQCDTDGGSSGSPVFRTDKQPWRVVAIHLDGEYTDAAKKVGWNWGLSLEHVPLGGLVPLANP